MRQSRWLAEATVSQGLWKLSLCSSSMIQYSEFLFFFESLTAQPHDHEKNPEGIGGDWLVVGG